MVTVSVIVGAVLHVDINPFLKGKQCFLSSGINRVNKELQLPTTIILLTSVVYQETNLEHIAIESL